VLQVYGSLVALALAATGALAQTVPETEPNNTPAQANRAVLGGQASGSLNFVNDMGTNGDDGVDWWKFDAAAGQMIFAKVEADEYGSFLDSRLGLYASDGTTQLAHNDSWDGFDPYIAYQAPTTGTYYLAIATGPGVANHGSYTIKFSEAKCPVSSEAPEPNDNPAQAVPISVGQTIHGFACPYSDDGTGDPDYFKVQLSSGTKIAIQIDGPDRARPAFG
jgi:hypothetical protein